MRRSYTYTFFWVLVGSLLLTGCGSSSTTTTTSTTEAAAENKAVSYQLGAPLSDTTLAVVVRSAYGSDTLTTSAYEKNIEKRVQRIPSGDRSADTVRAVHREVVRRFAEGHLLQSKARSDAISVDSAEVETRLQKIQRRYRGKEELRKRLAQSNMTIDSLRSLIADRIRTQALQEQMMETATAPTAEEVQAYSEAHPRIRAQHILLKVSEQAPQATVDSVRQTAATLIDSAKAGADFAALARRHSEGPSASKGGDLGFFSKDKMVKPFAEAAFALSDSGDVAPKPVRTRFGFHVIRLTDAGEPMDTSKARSRLMEKRRQAAYEQSLKALLEDATVQVHPSIVQAGLYREQSATEDDDAQ